ncbi:MAG: 30S ribosomal protein S2 [Anaerolineae bacterium]|nr:30S ribosomal protein S2 [Anaerolineae bacterium]
MSVVSMKALLETGVHFGHRAKKWNPKMKPYIFTERNGIHIIDLQQTLTSLEDAYELVRDTVANGGSVLFVGTKRQAQETIQQEAERASMPYVNQRWLGGTLTNWSTIRRRIEQLKRFEAERESGEVSLLTKKERLIRDRLIEKLQMRLGGLRYMTRLPELLFVVDVRREHTAVKEANTLNIPVLALVDTNCDPDQIDHVIPANDDAIRAIKLLAAKIADAALEGLAMRKAHGDLGEEAEHAPAMANVDLDRYDDVLDDEDFDADEEDEAYLGEATLAKLRTGDLTFDEDQPTDEAGGRKRKKQA